MTNPEPTADILDVVAVVTGEHNLTLTGWQYDHAIAAMTALGHSTRHIAYSLNRTEDAIRLRARRLGVPANPHDQRPDWFAIDMVTSGAACMRLLNIDRLEAIRIMADRGMPETRWDPFDPLYISGGSQCPHCLQHDLNEQATRKHAEK